MEEKVRSKRNESLLIVEDDESQLRTLTAIMEEEGFEVIGCSTATEAIEHIKHLDIGVVILDLRLPDLSGTQLLDRLAGATDKIRVIINTAYSSYESAKEALNFGAFAYVEKAGDPDELLRYVHRAFQASLRSYADELETAVAERTHDLLQANELLNKKIKEQEKTENLRRQERDKAQKYLDTAAVMLVAIDSEERIGLINRKGCEILGYKEEEIIGKNWFDNFLPERIRGQVKTVFEKVMREEVDSSEYYENLILTKSGDERLIAWHNTVLKDEKGSVIATLSSGEDITERKKAEEMLRGNEEKLRSIIEHSVEVFYVHDTEHKLTYISPQSKEVFGYAPGEMKVKWTALTTDNSINEKGSEPTERALRTGKKQEPYLLEIRRKDGESRIIEVDESPVKDEKGKVVAVSGALRDVTDRVRAQEAYRSLVDLSLQGLAIFQGDSIVFTNQAMSHITGYSEEEMLAMTPQEIQAFVHPEDRAMVWARHRDRLD
ncbi:MAG: PAS domain S-box protein, partial [Planctomycetes bacterium]|nr:PAS domain S-box protein [Planctomycetota bacterium]